jgi:Protein of unknown function (DUF3891)
LAADERRETASDQRVGTKRLMIVREEPNGEQILIGQTDHSRLAGQFAAHWGNGCFAAPAPFEPVARAAAFHDFGYLRYETAPHYDPQTRQTPNFRNVVTDAQRLEEYQWNADWLLALDPYAATLTSMHRTGLWRGRYEAIVHPPHAIRQQKPEVDAFVLTNEARQSATIAARGWDRQQMRINYRLLQVWDLLSLYFSCAPPAADYIEPVPTSYQDHDGLGIRLNLKPLGNATIAIDPYPFHDGELRIQLCGRRTKQTTFEDHEAFVKAYFQAPLELMEWSLVNGAS